MDISHIRSENAMQEFQNTYNIKEVLGQYVILIRGAFGVVSLVQHKETNQKYASKLLKKRIGSTSAYEQQELEVQILKSIKHENIIQLHEVYECPSKIVLVMELCEGGQLVNALRETEFCSDETIRDIITQLVDAVSILNSPAYLHRSRIIHRDIKPENILLKTKAVNDQYIIKMADFGLACYTNATSTVDNIAGTPMYMAPEIVQKLGYNHQADIWSIGVMLYLLLCQYDKEAEYMLHEMIKNGKIEYPAKYWATIDPRARNLVEMILRFDPAMRISAGEIKSHPWITNNNAQQSGNVIDLMRSYNAERRFKTAIKAILAFNRFIVFGREGTAKRISQIPVQAVEEKKPKIIEKSIFRLIRKSIEKDAYNVRKGQYQNSSNCS